DQPRALHGRKKDRTLQGIAAPGAAHRTVDRVSGPDRAEGPRRRMNDTITAGDTIVRDAVDDDMVAIQAIYAHHVLHGLASFEEVAPDVAELRRRRDEILKRRLPYRVAEVGGAVKGYAYAGPYRPRSAY